MRLRTVTNVVLPAFAIASGVLAYHYHSSNMAALAAARAANAGAKFTGRHALVVGGTSGIGHGVALRLAKADFAVTIVGRNAAAGATILEQLRAAGGGPHEFMACDASLLSNVRRTAAEYAAAHPTLDVLVLTQGVGTLQGRTETAEGLDVKLALHYYGRMAFIDSLLPSLRRAPSGRVLSVLSAGVHPPYAEYATDPELKTHYSLANAANAACFYNDVSMDALSRDPANAAITFVHAAPGMVDTNWGSDMPWAVRQLLRVVKLFAMSLEDCGEFMSVPLLARRDAGGFMLMTSTATPAAPTSLHDVARDTVWASTRDVLARVPALPVPAAGGAAGGAGAVPAAAAAAAAELK